MFLLAYLPHNKTCSPLNPSAIRFIPNTIRAGNTHGLDINARTFLSNTTVNFIGHPLNPNVSCFCLIPRNYPMLVDSTLMQ